MLQPHNVVDAKPACMAHVRAYQMHEALIAFLTQRVRMKRRQTPILPSRIIDIGWRADPSAGYNSGCTCPGLSAGAIGAHGEVPIETHRHAAFDGGIRDSAKLLIGNPLQ